MTKLSLAARNLLAQDTDLRALVGHDSVWTDGWIFDQTNQNVTVENSQTCMIVCNEVAPWTASNNYSTQRFPTLRVDIWADPQRNANNSVYIDDTQDKIMAIFYILQKYFHTVDMTYGTGNMIYWGTEDEISSMTGVPIFGSQHMSGPSFQPIEDGNGGQMSSFSWGINSI